jgi:hypothetical protein
VRQRDDFGGQRLAWRWATDDDRAFGLLQARCENLGGADRELVHQHDHRLGVLGLLGIGDDAESAVAQAHDAQRRLAGQQIARHAARHQPDPADVLAQVDN